MPLKDKSLQDRVCESILKMSNRNSSTPPEGVARRLVLGLVGTESPLFVRAANMVENILTTLLKDEADKFLHERYSLVLDEVKEIKKRLTTEGIPTPSPRSCPSSITSFARNFIIPHETKTGKAYLLSDFIRHLQSVNLSLDDVYDGFWVLNGKLVTPYGIAGVEVSRAPIVGNYDFTVSTIDSRSGHSVITSFEDIFMQRTVVLCKRTDNPLELLAIFGGKPHEFYEQDMKNDACEVISRRMLERFGRLRPESE